jgi:hypothetical protein
MSITTAYFEGWDSSCWKEFEGMNWNELLTRLELVSRVDKHKLLASIVVHRIII